MIIMIASVEMCDEQDKGFNLEVSLLIIIYVTNSQCAFVEFSSASRVPILAIHCPFPFFPHRGRIMGKT